MVNDSRTDLSGIYHSGYFKFWEVYPLSQERGRIRVENNLNGTVETVETLRLFESLDGLYGRRDDSHLVKEIFLISGVMFRD